MFPERVKIHRMINRNEEQFEVKHANTERFLKSAIPHMQRLLNDDKNNLSLSNIKIKLYNAKS